MGKGRRPPETWTYKVGYDRPPESTRFQPGQSGNPRGRPRQQKTIGASFQQAVSRRVRIQENGVTKRVLVKDIIATQLTNQAAKGDLRATKLLFDLMDRYCGSSEQPPIMLQLLPGDEQL